jgi:hypothetical protein
MDTCWSRGKDCLSGSNLNETKEITVKRNIWNFLGDVKLTVHIVNRTLRVAKRMQIFAWCVLSYCVAV